MKNKVIDIHNLDFAYEKQTILKALDLEVFEGEFVAVVGENGVGKSTLLSLILGTQKCQQGSIRIFGVENNPSAVYARIACIAQNAVLRYKHFPTTIEELIKIHTKYLKTRINVADCLERVGLLAQAKNCLNELSGGQLQRVGLLLALLKNAELIILDEPTSGIDKSFTQAFFSLLHDLSHKEGKTVLCVTHDLQDVAPWIDRVYEIREGRAQLSEMVGLRGGERV